MLKKSFLILTALCLIGCASDKDKQRSSFSLLIPKRLTYQNQLFDLVKTERKTLVYGRFTYADKDNHQLHYLLSSMVMPLDQVQQNLAEVASEKGYKVQFKTANHRLYALTNQKTNYKQSVSQNTDCGTLTVIKNSQKPTALLDVTLGDTLDQMKCQKNN
ncbi:hypothetical protein EDC44_10428 [Cricetibacter osteomyelitidis]|uniref:Uncharacterized protein n=1 Tax=Cricetibacter osteomyelitidis TaxID=1521931 RepID=A0A4R2T3C8_9PAST|nr:hypothetical protein [Cricetibacter osteomyelitidis]TCP96495.1 hypothetical protein EDC44_10428 [Cricetibacter osteomyelitidis]